MIYLKSLPRKALAGAADLAFEEARAICNQRQGSYPRMSWLAPWIERIEKHVGRAASYSCPWTIARHLQHPECGLVYCP